MATSTSELSDRSGTSLLESHKGYDPRIVVFYFVLVAGMITLAVGLGYEQLSKTSEYRKAERQQNQRRIIMPGPRGNIYDRNGQLLVGNRPRFSVRLLIDQLGGEMRKEQVQIKRNFEKADEKDIPTPAQRLAIARVAVVQRYLDKINAILGRDEKVNPKDLAVHFQRELLVPYTLIEDLTSEEYARLLERLPVNSPAQVYMFPAREYPFGSAASHTLGYVGTTTHIDDEIEGLSGEDLKTFPMKGSVGRDGAEKQFDELLQGQAGGSVHRVDPSGNRINPPLQVVRPKQGKNLFLSLDIDMQLAAEQALVESEMPAGTAVALDVNTGEVFVLASKPDYNLSDFVPKLSNQTYAEIESRGGWQNRVTQGLYMPGSSFKVLMSIAGLRAGVITPTTTYHCAGVYKVGNRLFPCHDRAVHGDPDLARALEKSCNVFYYQAGLELGPDRIAAEARRFHLNSPTGIEVPHETKGMIIPDPEWKRRVENLPWTGGDTANVSIGQGAVTVTPLQMACFAASVARDEVWTQPTLVHDPNRPRQKHEKIGLTSEQRAKLLEGMERVTGRDGTGHLLTDNKPLPRFPFRIAGKTGTAQKRTAQGTINFAWFIGFAPIENPEIAIAVAIEGDTPGEETGGGRYASPVVHAILKAWHEKKTRPGPKPVLFKTE